MNTIEAVTRRLTIATDEGELLERLRAGNEEAFASLVDRHHTRDDKPDAHDITCRQAVALMTDYLDGVLGPDDRALIEAHLAECEGCAEHLRQIRITVAVTGRIGEDDLDPAAREDLMDLYRRWRRDKDL